jgi:proteasome alpha subunit
MTMPFYVPPEQLIKDRAEFAKKGIARGRAIVVLEYDEGILLIGENPSRSLHKVAEIYDSVAFAGVGRFNEFEMLRVAGIRYADVKGFSYARADVTGKGLANAYSQTVGQIFTHEVKPYEVEILVAEVGETAAGNHLYHVRFDGTLGDEEGFATLGGDADQLHGRIAAGHAADMSLDAAIALATSSLAAAADQEVDPGAWEAAVLDRNLGRRKFRRLDPAEISTSRPTA